MPVRLDDVRSWDRATFVAAFGSVFERSPWVARDAWAARPFEDVAALHEAMVDAVEHSPAGCKLDLIRAHPDLAGKAALAGEVAEASQREQRGAGLDQLTPEEYARFQALNRRYRERFGFPFILAVRGHDKHSILEAFELRLDNDPVTERQRALEEIYRIARFRLDDLVDTEGAP